MNSGETKQTGALPLPAWQVQEPRFVWGRLLFAFSSGVIGGLVHILLASSGYPIIISIFIDPQRIWFAVPLALAIPLSIGLAAPFLMGRQGNSAILPGMAASILAWVFSWASGPSSRKKWKNGRA
ncbi:MAG TPA: hypothetical protein VGF67_10335 [Ktedonobacteraceae bacterium]|jgi:hypothetical protein